MSLAFERRVPGFWQLQAGGWILLYLLCLAASAPHLRESFIFAYNTWDIIVLFAASLVLRPVLRQVNQRWQTSWLRLQGGVFCLCFLTGSLATYLISLVTFGYRGFRLSYWTLSGVQCSLILFLWAVLYMGVRQWNALQTPPLPGPASLAAEAAAREPAEQPGEVAASAPTLATTFAIRNGTRLEIVPVEKVLWMAASKDYVELHTSTSTHLLRDTMKSLEQRLDATLFMRIHRSRIVRIDQIRELVPLENGEYRIRLHDGSEHRSSRTYAIAVAAWVRSGAGDLATSRRRPGGN